MKRDLVSIDDLATADLERYLALAARVEAMPERDKVHLLVGRLLMVLFFEPSTRTRLSFESAMKKLGGSCAGFAEAAATSVAKGETLVDTIRTVAQYGDAIVMRHPKEGAARLAAESCALPVVNAGDGANQHPTQTLLDLYTIRKLLGRLENLSIALVGDLRYSRTVHSLVNALRRFAGVRFVLVSPPSLRLDPHTTRAGPGETATFEETTDLRAAVRQCELLYMTRIQKERFPDLIEYERVKDAYVLDAAVLREARPGLRVMHPLPRVNEISRDVDALPAAAWFEQVRNGLFVRQAILLDVLGVTP